MGAMKKWYTVQELADLLKLNRATVYLAIDEGRLKVDEEFSYFKVFRPSTVTKLLKRRDELKESGLKIQYHLFRKKRVKTL